MNLDDFTPVIKELGDVIVENKNATEEILNGFKHRLDEFEAGVDLRSVTGGASPSRAATKRTYESANGTPLLALSKDDRLSDHIKAPAQPLNFAKLVLGNATGDFSGAPEELAVMQNQSVGVGADGGYLAPGTVASEIIDTARNASRTIEAGADTLIMPSGEVDVIRVEQDPVSYWRKENKAITPSDAVLGRVKMIAMTCGCLIKVSEEMLQDAPNAGALLLHLIGESLGLSMDYAALFGTGKGQPRGLFNTPNVSEIDLGTDGLPLTSYVPFLDAIEKIETANGAAKSAIYAPRTKRSLSGLVTGISGDMTPLTMPADVKELQRLTTNQIPVDQSHGTATDASCVLMGDFSQMAFGIRQNLHLASSISGDDNGFGKNQIQIRGTMRMDVAVFRPTHFAKITGIIPA